MEPVRLIHWNAAEAKAKVEKLQGCGYEIDFSAITGPEEIRRLREHPPAALVIDLTRLPSHGRDLAVGIRKYKATRHVPLVFVEGDAEKVERIKQLLPDAVYTTWRGIRRALPRAIAHPPSTPVQPESAMAGYSGTPLPKKLGIKADSVVVLAAAPKSFLQTLGTLPANVTFRRQARGPCDLVIWFVKSQKELERRIHRMGALAGEGGLWVTWPKKTSGVTTDLSQPIVRKIGLASGLVDYKVAAIDATWTGLRFTRRKRRQQPPAEPGA